MEALTSRCKRIKSGLNDQKQITTCNSDSLFILLKNNLLVAVEWV